MFLVDQTRYFVLVWVSELLGIHSNYFCFSSLSFLFLLELFHSFLMWG